MLPCHPVRFLLAAHGCPERNRHARPWFLIRFLLSRLVLAGSTSTEPKPIQYKSQHRNDMDSTRTGIGMKFKYFPPDSIRDGVLFSVHSIFFFVQTRALVTLRQRGRWSCTSPSSDAIPGEAYFDDDNSSALSMTDWPGTDQIGWVQNNTNNSAGLGWNRKKKNEKYWTVHASIHFMFISKLQSLVLYRFGWHVFGWGRSGALIVWTCSFGIFLKAICFSIFLPNHEKCHFLAANWAHGMYSD